MKHFHRNIWHLGENWENTAHIFGAPDSDREVEQNERVLVASLEISDDEQGQGAEEEDGESLSLPPNGYAYDVQASPRRARRYHGTSFPLTKRLGTSPYLPRYLSDRSHDL